MSAKASGGAHNAKAGGGAYNAGDAMSPKEVEVLVAEIENRLRDTLLRTIRPSLEVTANTAQQLKSVTEEVHKHEKFLQITEELREAVQQQGDLSAMLQHQLEIHESQTAFFEKHTQGEIVELRKFREHMEEQLVEHGKQLAKQSRELNHIWEEKKFLQSQQDGAVQKIWAGMERDKKKHERAKEDIMELVRELQKQREDLLEELFGDDNGLVKLGRDFVELSRFVSPLPAMQIKLDNAEKDIETLQKLHVEVVQRCEADETDHANLLRSLDDRLHRLKIDTKNDANALVAHHAALMRDIRDQYSKEIESLKDIQLEYKQFEVKVEKICAASSRTIESESRRIDAVHREFVSELEDINKQRKKDRQLFEGELGSTRKELSLEQLRAKRIWTSLEYLSRIVHLVLEGERISSAIFVQDFADRAGERWLSPPSELGRHPQPALPAENLEKQLRSGQCDGDSRRTEMVVVDWRKGVARCEYLPGQVAYGSRLYDRRDILLLHHTLLQKAHTALTHGPPEPDELLSAIAVQHSPRSNLVAARIDGAQPGANGEVQNSSRARGAKQAAKGEKLVDWDGAFAVDASEDPRLSQLSTAPPSRYRSCGGTGNSSGRQRPGSQGQPQAVGSRGTQFGSLGETEPPPHVMSPAALALKLPSIGTGAAGPPDGPCAVESPSAAAAGLGQKGLTAR